MNFQPEEAPGAFVWDTISGPYTWREVMGEDASEGLIDSQSMVFEYKNMMVCDKSLIL